MDITKDIRPLTEFKRDTTRFMSHLKETGRPSILTVNGKPSLVIMDAQAWQDIQDQIEYVNTVSAIRKGLSQARSGQGAEASDFFDQLDAGKV
ncbi:MAG: prevent-host-death protein [Rhodospirillales bacterium RIFCSPLOWO2_02_FULL_58_16]|nr:MAG: prevent-host-death protein [Rhodospirillales bacterium RIFCSPLOWO2_02_FULL_58_16]